MIIDETKYNRLFIETFQANKSDLNSEFSRVVSEHGYTEEIKILFYEAAFTSLMKKFKKQLQKDEKYVDIIVNCYTLFITTLKDDGIDTTKFEEELNNFIGYEIPKIETSVEIDFIPENKQYNLNTKYGRRKAREQAARNYQNGTDQYRKEIDNLRLVVYIIILFVLAIIYLIKK